MRTDCFCRSGGGGMAQGCVIPGGTILEEGMVPREYGLGGTALPPPHLYRVTHACENITFPQLRWRAVRIGNWWFYPIVNFIIRCRPVEHGGTSRRLRNQCPQITRRLRIRTWKRADSPKRRRKERCRFVRFEVHFQWAKAILTARKRSYVFTRVCLSTGGEVSRPRPWGSRPRPRGGV